jgi:biotin synthase-related radical SAM superfamily protein
VQLLDTKNDTNSFTLAPKLIRVSLGSAIALGLLKGFADALPSTVYLLTYHEGKCIANCQFCSQARSSASRSDSLSRVTWPTFLTEKVISEIQRAVSRGLVRRVCLQAVNYPEAFVDVLNLIRSIRSKIDAPISLSCQPFRGEQLQKLADAGLDRIGIPLDAATEALFSKIKGPEAGGTYAWHEHLRGLEVSAGIFGRGHVSTHLMVGLGENDAQLVSLIQTMVDMGVYPSLFAFTPVQGTSLENWSQPPLKRYRRIQLAQYLVTKGKARYSMMKFDQNGDLMDYGVSQENLKEAVASGEPFLTSGCPDCNRPFYNERAGGPLYNYPRPLTRDEVTLAEEDLLLSED